MSNIVYHSPESRGTTNQGWLHCRHVFSYGNYYNAERMHYGALRVINEDMIAPSSGFGMHPHTNMEMITIVREGEIEYKDNLNNVVKGKKGDIMAISAGTGIFHSEYNHSKDNSLKILQLWLLPKTQNVKPRISLQNFNFEHNALTKIVSPEMNGCLWIHQDVWIYYGLFGDNKTYTYELKNPLKNSVYIYMLSGKIEAENTEITQGSGLGISKIRETKILCTTGTEFLLLEVPDKSI